LSFISYYQYDKDAMRSCKAALEKLNSYKWVNVRGIGASGSRSTGWFSFGLRCAMMPFLEGHRFPVIPCNPPSEASTHGNFRHHHPHIRHHPAGVGGPA
jgi:hypothetical protein